jgi:hypothetical protein
MFFRWLKISDGERQHVWLLYGWYCGLMLCGSCVGVLTWAAWMQNLAHDFTSIRDASLPPSQKFSMYSLAMRWLAAFRVMYAIEFLCLSTAKLMVLDRMSDFVAVGWISRRWTLGRRIVMAAVAVGNLVGLAGNVAAATRYGRVSDLVMAASADLSDSNAAAVSQMLVAIREELELANAISSVQAFCEVAVLLLIVFSFAVVGIACARRISSSLSQLGAADAAVVAGSQLQRQIIRTTAVVFVTFLVRSAYSTMSAVALKLQDISNKCPGVNPCDSSCTNVFTHIALWMLFTPEFQLIVVLVSKPLPLLVALWGMTSQRMLHAMRRRQLDSEMAEINGGVLDKLAFWRSARAWAPQHTFKQENSDDKKLPDESITQFFQD